MQSLSLLPFLLVIFIVTIHADDPFLTDRNNAVASTTTTTATPASTTKSNSTSTIQASTTSTTASSTSASATSTSSATSSPFQWNGGEIAALVILLGFIIIGIVVIATWQVRRMLARRRENAGLGAYSKHKMNASVDMDAPDTDAVMIMDQRSRPLQPYGNLTNSDLERQPTRLSAASYRYPAIGGSTHAIAVSRTNPSRQARSPSSYSQAALRPSSENTLHRLYSFEDVSRSTT